ncbi:LuxR family transcriptional regulator [Novosphingobium sp. RL4]|uniref:helix-turn-helix transcriptional regulator n=1 Tax=Novosphingobium sp. RL4 TaxID=3109595 RepID=UPI002D77C42C|nr:LuxR family transcriptional regulator [Novosphingobium sp. RL4]WRT94468.1 LuxR family transcriptional regulator [Novosphingobium sp. RL4]
MHIFDTFSAFMRSANDAANLFDLNQVLAHTAHELGYDYFALTHHVDWRCRVPGAVRLHNYPEAWVQFFDSSGLGGADPVQRASERAGFGFRWHRIGDFIPVSDQDRHIFKMAEEHGIGDGFTVPFHLPGEHMGSCSFAVKPGRTMVAPNLLLAQLIGLYAFDVARRFLDPQVFLMLPRAPLLTNREAEIARLVAAGKSNKEAGKILGISPHTARQHVSESFGKLGVHDRAALTYRALRSGEISYAQVPI